MKQELRLVVLGAAGQIPFAGVAWQVLHYLEGFRRLGCDVTYVEDTLAWPYDAEHETITDDPAYTVGYLARLMSWWGMPHRWAYRAASQSGRTYGLDTHEFTRVFESADALVNLHGATRLRDEHLRVPVRIYVETDPVRPQIEIAKGNAGTIDLLSAHTHHFSYGENLGAQDCGVPIQRFCYVPTRQPLVLDWWPPAAGLPPANAVFTTVASWDQSGNDIEWNGEVYGWSKHAEFLKFMDLPRHAGQAFELALACSDAEAIRQLEEHRWRIRDALTLSRDILPYQKYILTSRGEFTVAKDQNIRLRSGWFSDRSACYLAAGRPVITQDTAFGNVLPVGEGLFAFTTMDHVLAALEAINADYAKHSAAARGIAEEYFKAERVLADLIDRVGI
jgi:hypothetical protein